MTTQLNGENPNITEAIEKAKALLDAGYVTTKGALFMIILSLKDLGIEMIKVQIIEMLGISKAAFYKARKEIQEQEGWKLTGKTSSIWISANHLHNTKKANP
jgi:hypothetical protein